MWKILVFVGAATATLYFTKRYFGGKFYVCSLDSLEGKVIIVTGANSGIGREIALELVQQGATVVLACRNQVEATTTCHFIIEKSGRSTVTCGILDLNSFDSIRKFAQSFKASGRKLYALVNNAGVFYYPPSRTVDRYDVTFQTNYLGPFLLTHLLLDTFKQNTHGRIINVSSEAHRCVKHMNVSNVGLLSDHKDYDRFQAYGQSKLCLMQFTYKLSKDLQKSGITVNAVNPGNVETRVYRHFPLLTNPILAAVQWPIRSIVVKTPWEGAQSILYSALEPSLEGMSGKYISDCQEENPSVLALDDALAEELYAASLKWCNIPKSVGSNDNIMDVKTLLQLVESLVSKQVLEQGVSTERAQENALCSVSITHLEYEGSACEYVQQSLELARYFCNGFEGVHRIGESDAMIGRALECCMLTMFPGETSLVTLTIKSLCESFCINDNNVIGLIHCQVRLNEVTNEIPFYALEGDKKYNIAMENKVRGVELFKSERYVEAFLRFSKALKYLISIDNVDNNLGNKQPEHVTSLSIILYNNIASCHLKRGNFVHVISLCSKVVAAQPENVKALFRRAVAKVELGELADARDDFQSVLKLEPDNAVAALKLREVMHKMKEINTDYSKVVRKMFEL